jgi:hypothetical protein
VGPQAGDETEFGQIDASYGRTLATTPPEDDGPVWMVNLMKYRDVAVYTDGRPSTISGREADDRYAPLSVLADLGAEVVFFGDVEHQLVGDEPTWDRIGVVKYPTRRSFLEMQSRPDFMELYAHKEAGMESTIIIGCQPTDAPLPAAHLSDSVAHSPTPEDQPIILLHVLALRDDAPARMDPTLAGLLGTPHGGRANGWFEVEGTIVGDGRPWHEVRFSLFPSRAAFDAAVLDEERLAHVEDLEDQGIEDSYALLVRPMIDALVRSMS